MNMMTQPDDNLFQDLLADYAAPVSDDGFTDAVMHKLQAETARTERIRRFAIYAACFIGGMIAATQIPTLMGLIAGMDVAVPELPSSDALTASPLAFPQWAMISVVLLGFVLWAALDRKTSELF